MDSFYLTVASIAVIILILMLTYVGVLLYYTKTSDTFPPMRNQCPDYWELTDSNKCVFPANSASKNRGSLKSDATTPALINLTTEPRLKDVVVASGGKSHFDMNSEVWNNLYGKKGELCNKKYWANLNNISWDGVSNSNEC
jgi:hypothetical protein